MVRVREGPLGHRQGGVEGHTLLFQQPDELRDGHGRVRVVELDGAEIGEGGKIIPVFLFIAAQDILQRGRREDILPVSYTHLDVYKRQVISRADIMGDAGTDMVGQKIPVKGVDGSIDRGGLHQNIRAVGVLFHHAADAANLALNAAEPVAQALPLCFGPFPVSYTHLSGLSDPGDTAGQELGNHRPADGADASDPCPACKPRPAPGGRPEIHPLAGPAGRLRDRSLVQPAPLHPPEDGRAAGIFRPAAGCAALATV